ncbi:MAG: cadherin repeat domain-containing protein [Bacteroidota bacterium]
MKTNFKLFFALLPFLSMIIACSEEDSDSFMPSTSDINVTIDENPNSGESIGTVATNLTGTLVYSISSQSAENAFSINSSTGEVRIDDASKFNFEDMMTLEAIVSVTNSEQNANSTVTVSLNDIDDIWYFLSSSRDAYMAAEADSWIQITGSEYERLAENLTDISRVGTSNEVGCFVQSKPPRKP